MRVREDQIRQALIENVESVFTAVNGETEKHFQPRSYIVKRLVSMHVAGWSDTDYETLVTVSGFGLSFAYHPGEKFYAHYLIPEGADDRMARATGYGWEWLSFDSIERYWQTLKNTIDNGKPVHAPFLEELLFTGYQESDDKAQRKVYPLDYVFIKPGLWFSWELFEEWFEKHSRGRLGRHSMTVKKSSEKESLVEVLQTIVQLAYKDPRSEKEDLKGVKWGLKGIEAYATDISDTSKSGRKGDYFHSGWLGCHNIYPQWTARQLTARYLEKHAGLFSEKIAQILLKAAKEYNAAHAGWLVWEKHLGRKGKAPADAWDTKKHRIAGARGVLRAADHERKAVENIQNALDEIGKK